MSNEEDRSLLKLSLKLAALEIESSKVRQEIVILERKKRARNRKGQTTSTQEIVAHDANRNQIRKGDRVQILSKGKFHSKEGTIDKITEKRITIVDKRGVKIIRASKNVLLIQEK